RFTTLKNQTVVAIPEARRPRPPSSEGERWTRRLRTDPTGRDAVVCLAAIAAFSSLLRMALVSLVHAPTIFSDELGYVKLAQSIGRTGHFGLFDDRGLSYSPLYPALLAPIYALGASAPTAYTLIKLANAVLISLAVFP